MANSQAAIFRIEIGIYNSQKEKNYSSKILASFYTLLFYTDSSSSPCLGVHCKPTLRNIRIQ